MTTERNFSGLNRDSQDHWEMQLWGKVEYTNNGAYMRVRGNGTNEVDVAVLNVGFGMNLPENSDAEVALVGMGSDPNNKMVLQTIPFANQRQWKEKTSGIQAATDKGRALEFNEKRAWLEDLAIALGRTGLIEIVDGKVYIRGDLYVKGEIKGVVTAPAAIPEFEA